MRREGEAAYDRDNVTSAQLPALWDGISDTWSGQVSVCTAPPGAASPGEIAIEPSP